MIHAQTRKFSTPFADILPPPSSDELAGLRANIEANGITEPLLVSEDNEILDGHNRLAVATEYDLEFPWKIVAGSGTWTDAEKAAFVFNCNQIRRNLSNEQKFEAAKPIAKELRKARRTQKEIAELLGISQQWVSKWCGSPSGHNTTRGNVSALDARIKLPRTAGPVIAERIEKGETATAIAADLKVTPRTVKRHHGMFERQREERKRRQQAVAKLGDATYDVHVGDFRKVGCVVPANSVDLIFTDPPYLADEIADGLYADLAAFAAQVLRPGGLCFAYTGHLFLPQVLDQLREHLEYVWTCVALHPGQQSRIDFAKIQTGYKPILMFRKPPAPRPWWNWFYDVSQASKEKSHHAWQQSLATANQYIGYFCPPKGVVCDPFCGSGTTCMAAKQLGRRYVAFEIDEATAKKRASSDRGGKRNGARFGRVMRWIERNEAVRKATT